MSRTQVDINGVVLAKTYEKKGMAEETRVHLSESLAKSFPGVRKIVFEEPSVCSEACAPDRHYHVAATGEVLD